MKILFVSLGLVLAFGSCRHTNNRVTFVDETGTTVIELRSKPSDQINLEAFVDSVKFVKLETTEECLIHRIGKVFVAEGRIIVLHHRTDEVFFFDERGKYITKISRKGRGPQEYHRITSIMFDPVNNHILVFCQQQSKLLFYDLDGKFVRAISDFSDNMLVRDIINLPNGNFLCYEGVPNPDGNVNGVGLWETDSDGRFLKWLLQPEGLHPVIGNAVPTNLHYRNNYEVGFWDVFTDDDFHYTNDTLRRTRTYDLPLKRGKDFPGTYMTNEKFASRVHMLEKGNYAISQWHDSGNNEVITILHSLRDDTVLPGMGVDYRSSSLNALPGQILDNNLNDVFVEVLYSTMVQMYAESYPPENLRILSELTQGMSKQEIENMNPILEFFYLKK